MMKNLRLSKILFMLVCFLTTIWASAQTQRYVSATGYDEGPCTTLDQPCATINFAIGQANPGDTINLAGSLTQTSTINKANLTIKGDGQGSTKIRAGINSQTPVFTVTANNVKFESMTLSNEGTMNGGIWIQGATTGLRVKRVTFDSLGKVQGSTSGTAGSGIRFLPSVTDVRNSFSNVLVDSCIFKNYDEKSSVGIVSSNCVISNVTVTNSQFDSLFIGIWSSGPVNGLTLTGNTFTMESLDNSSGTSAIYLGDIT